jgi:hypothetical protein
MNSPVKTAAPKNAEALAAAEKASDYEWGFVSDIEQEFAPKGLSEDTVRFISAKKNEPEWMLDWRLKAYRALADHDAARLGEARRPADRLSGRLLLRGPQEEGRSSAVWTSSIPRSCASTRSSASRSRSRRCSPASKARAR